MVEELIFMESQTWEALKLSGKALIPFLSPDCVMLFPSEFRATLHNCLKQSPTVL